MAGICPRFCHTYFCVKRVKLIRPKDTGGQCSHRPKSKQGGWAGLPDLWPGECVIVQSEKKNCCAGVGWICRAAPWWPWQHGPRRRLCLLAWPLTGWWRKVCPSSSSLSSTAHSLPRSSGAFQLSQQQLTPLGAQASCALVLAGTWGCPESGAALLSLSWFFLLSLRACRGKCVLCHRLIFFFLEGCRLHNCTQATWSRSARFQRTAYGCGDGEVPN